MIHIIRPSRPDFMDKPGNKWDKEIEAAKAHYTIENNKAFKFKHYRDGLLKDELRKIFPKCAYCESPYSATSDGDVEHFRPKGKIKERNPPKPGYYWLANDWNNLFLACSHCNQRRRHKLHGRKTEQPAGKMDQFPLKPEDKRLSGPDGDLLAEESARLLLNPCIDRPEKHLAYEINEGVVVPLTEIGSKSVEVFVLQRPYLVQERKKVLLRLLWHMKLVKQLLVKVNDNPADTGDKDSFETAFDILLSYTDLHAPYAGMCRYFVAEFLKENQILER